MIRVLSSEEETYRRLARDLWDHGHVLRDNKYRWLYLSYTVVPSSWDGRHRGRLVAQLAAR